MRSKTNEIGFSKRQFYTVETSIIEIVQNVRKLTRTVKGQYLIHIEYNQRGNDLKKKL